MGNEDWDARALLDCWVAGLLARRARGDDKAVLRGLYQAHQRIEQFVELHPEARDALLPLLDVLREALVEEFHAWQQQRKR
jgi:hypothetical protein